MLACSDMMLAQHPEFDRLRSKFENGNVYKAEFSHSYTDSYTQEESVTSGTIWINKNGYRLEAEGQIIVVDGEQSTVYDSSRNRVIISDYNPDEDDFAPSRLLSGLDETYEVISEKKLGGQTRVVLESTDEFAVFLEIEIVISSSGKPASIIARDFAENVIETVFSKGEFMDANPEIFELDPPEDAELVDMRY